VVLNPAVLPGENTSIVYTGWIHGSTEPKGTYVFRYTIHGWLNGDPVDPDRELAADLDDRIGGAGRGGCRLAARRHPPASSLVPRAFLQPRG
jgi:hypothetical protein